MAKVYCVCDLASTEKCAECPKGVAVKPDVKIQYPGWTRILMSSKCLDNECPNRVKEQ